MSLSGEIVVMGKFDGGNPQCSSDIVKVDDLTFRIYPYSEDRDDNYMFRVDVRVCSSYRKSKHVTLFFEWRAWRAERYMDSRRIFYYKHEDGEWKIKEGQVDGNVSTLTLEIPPGETIISLNPLYNYERLQRYVRSIRKNPYVESWIAGFSEEKRNIWCIKLTDPRVSEEAKRKLMIMARVHPYETSGSYCVESMINYLLSENPEASELLTKFIFYFVPMPNPDGVYNGLCKLTRVNGFDFSHGNVLTSRDKACKTVINLARMIKPQFALDIHGHMIKNAEQLGCCNERLLEEFLKLMPKPDPFNAGRQWKIYYRRYEPTEEKPEEHAHYGFRRFCAEELGAIDFLLGFAWLGRKIEEMEKIAITSLKALTTAILRTL